jgi:hypothetical protein
MRTAARIAGLAAFVEAVLTDSATDVRAQVVP